MESMPFPVLSSSEVASYSLPLGQSSVIRRPSGLARSASSTPPRGPRARPAFRVFRYRGAPRPGATGDEKHITTYTRAGLRVIAYRLRNHLPTVYTYFILHVRRRHGRPGPRTGPSASRIGIATSGPLRSVSGCARYGYPRPSVPVAVRVHGSARALARERAACGCSVPLYTTTGA